MFWGKKKRGIRRGPAYTSEEDAAARYDFLRAKVLGLKSADLELPRAPDEPFGALMEEDMGMPPVLLVALADGGDSLYMRNGYVIIGAGQHEEVREAGFEFIRVAEGHRHLFHLAESFPFPTPREARFYLLCNGGHLVYTMENTADRTDPGAAIFFAAHMLFKRIRLATERVKAERRL